MQHLKHFNVMGDMGKKQFLFAPFWSFSLCILLLADCNNNPALVAQTSPPSAIPPQDDYFFPYQLHQPSATFEMPDKLVEISGLSLNADKSQLIVTEDENAIIFCIDKATGKVVREIPYGKNGDYEGIEVVGEDVYVSKSSGKIYLIKKYGQHLQEVLKYDTPLTKDHDIEGLGFDATHQSLLLACKGQAPGADGLVDDLQFSKAIYRFSLKTHELDTIPAVVIDRQDILEYFAHHPPLLKTNKDGELEESSPEKLPCYPSAIAVHPFSGDYYFTSSKGKTLFVVSPQGTIVHIEKLDKRLHPQPEGLAFDSDGTLYLSDEGRDGPARIYRFAFQIVKNQ